jgi:hypothetical protein
MQRLLEETIVVLKEEGIKPDFEERESQTRRRLGKTKFVSVKHRCWLIELSVPPDPIAARVGDPVRGRTQMHALFIDPRMGQWSFGTSNWRGLGEVGPLPIAGRRVNRDNMVYAAMNLNHKGVCAVRASSWKTLADPALFAGAPLAQTLIAEGIARLTTR